MKTVFAVRCVLTLAFLSACEPGETQDSGIFQGDADSLDRPTLDADSLDTVYDSTQLDRGQTDSGHTDSGQTDSGHTDSGQADSGQTDSGQTDSGHSDSGQTDNLDDSATAFDSTRADTLPDSAQDTGWADVAFSSDGRNGDRGPEHHISITVEGDGHVETISQNENTITLKAVPDPDWRFSRWTGDVSGHDSQIEIGVDSDQSVVAIFIPLVVDNSTSQWFPPIRNQGVLGSCVAFSVTYYQLTYMVGKSRGEWNAKTGGDAFRFSPKWTYNFLNQGLPNKSLKLFQATSVLTGQGAATWEDFPYDSNYRQWSRDAATWQTALHYRLQTSLRIRDLDTTQGLSELKEKLAEGYILTFETDIGYWQYRAIEDDASTARDDSEVGKQACFYLDSTPVSVGHAMTIVGYNDEIWIDINDNSSVDIGEKGALRIANSWGTSFQDNGFAWFAYDAIGELSNVEDGPSANRRQGIAASEAMWLEVREDYSPKLLLRITINTQDRSLMKVKTGLASTAETEPGLYTRTVSALNARGGHFAFDGTTQACDGDFVLDLTDHMANLSNIGPGQRWFIGVENTGWDQGNTIEIVSVQIENPATQETVDAAGLPVTVADSRFNWFYVDYEYVE